MHIAASALRWVSVEDIPAETVAAKRLELTEEALASGKPLQVVEKMIEGRIRKFYDEVVLVRQPFILNLDQTVQDAMSEASQTLGATRVTQFARFRTGEGMEKPAV